MNILLVAVNSKYSHTNLALRLLKKYAACDNAKLAEYTINEPIGSVLTDIYRQNPDAVFFSCYIWNKEYICKICSSLKKISHCKIILGGPEVSFDTAHFMEKHPFIDACIQGEGEVTFKELLENNLCFTDVSGLAFNSCGKIIQNPPRPLIEDISTVPFPYTEEEIKSLSGRLIYYESSRGCPFNCSYCMSSTVKGVRYRNIDLVKKELKFFVDNNVKIVKLVDRTFNASPSRVYEIFKFLIENGGNTTFHFEIAAHILNDKIFELLKTAPKGLFQFEIGVQSTNPETIAAINRTTDFNRISYAVKRILENENIHVHLDLIAGLPYENFDSFKQSFNDVFALKPHMLQLGFLKLLHGTVIRDEEELHGYKYSDTPPYEVLSNNYVSFDDIARLKMIEDIVDKYHNSGAFSASENYLLTKYSSPFDLFSALADYFDRKGLFKQSHSKNGLYDILSDFAKDNEFDEIFWDCLKLDFISNGNFRTPSWSLLPYNEDLAKQRFSMIEENKDFFDDFSGIPPKDIIKKVHFEEFLYDILGNGEKTPCVYAFKKNGEIKKMK